MNARRHREPSRRRDAPRSTDPRPHANANPTVSTARLHEARFRQVGGAAAAAAARAAAAPPGGGGTNRSRPAAAPAASQRAWDDAMRRLPASGTLKVHAWVMHGTWMAHAWHMHDICMVHAWHMHGTCMVYAWYMLRRLRA